MSFLLPESETDDHETDPAVIQTSYDLLAQAALDQLMPTQLDARLRGPAPIVVLVEACSRAWSEALRREMSRRYGHARVRVYKTAPKRSSSYNEEEDHLILSVQEGQTVIAVSTDVAGLVPETLRLGADASLQFTGLSPRGLRKAIRLVTGKAARQTASGAALKLDLPDLCAAIRPLSTPGECLARMSLAAKRKAEALTSGSDVVPVTRLPLTAPVRQWADTMLLRMHQLETGGLSMPQSPFTLLGGPPGTGKTMLAESIAQAAGWRFVSTSAMAWFEGSDGYLGGVTKAAGNFFQQLAEQPLTLGFIDELDAIPDRALLEPRQREWWTTLVSALLLNIDKLRRSTAPSVLLAASNFPDRIDAALLRPQRISRTLRVDPPSSADEITAFFRYYIGDALNDGELHRVVLLALGLGLPSPAAIGDWVGSAKAAALGAGRPMVFADLERVILGQDTRPMHERRRVAVHESGHAIVAAVLDVPIQSVSILAGGNSGGSMLAQLRTSDFDRQRVENLVTVALAGRAADAVLLGIVDAAASADLAMATSLLADAHLKWGLYEQLLALDVGAKNLHELDLATREPLEAKLQQLMRRAEHLVMQHRKAILALARELLKVSVMSGDDVRKRIAVTSHALPFSEEGAGS